MPGSGVSPAPHSAGDIGELTLKKGLTCAIADPAITNTINEAKTILVHRRKDMVNLLDRCGWLQRGDHGDSEGRGASSRFTIESRPNERIRASSPMAAR